MNQDEDAVVRLRDHAMKGQGASFVKYVKATDADLVETLRAALGQGDTVVIKDYEVPETYLFSENRVIRERKLNPNQRYYIHCMSELH